MFEVDVHGRLHFIIMIQLRLIDDRNNFFSQSNSKWNGDEWLWFFPSIDRSKSKEILRESVKTVNYE